MSAMRPRRLAILAAIALASCIFDPGGAVESTDTSGSSTTGDVESADTSTSAPDDTGGTDTGTTEEPPDPDTSTGGPGCPQGVFGVAVWDESCWG
jgi:hypothetical protein